MLMIASTLNNEMLDYSPKIVIPIKDLILPKYIEIMI